MVATNPPGTNFANDQANGYVIADGFGGPNNGPATFPNGIQGAETIADLTVTGSSTFPAQTVVAAGTSQGTATAIPLHSTLIAVSTTTSSEGVKLPTAATGREYTVLAPTTKGVKVYGGAAGQLINTATTATTAYAMASGQGATFYGVNATHWRTTPLTDPGTFEALNATGLATLSGGQTLSGAYKQLTTTVAAAGATQGTATAIAAGAASVVVTVTASSEGVKLPTAATGRQIELIPPNTFGAKVYGGAAGQLINAGTTATTAYTMASGKPVVFYAVDATHWRATSVSSVTGTTGTFTGLISGSNGLTVSAGLATLSGGLTLTGAMKEALTAIASTGVTQGTAAAIAATAVLVRVSGASAAGVKLPTAATGKLVTIFGPIGHSAKVYGAAAGQLINAATTATTAFVVATVRPTTFIGVDTTHWQALKSA